MNAAIALVAAVTLSLPASAVLVAPTGSVPHNPMTLPETTSPLLPTPLTLQHADPAPPARDTLLALAGRARASRGRPAATRSTGRYTFVRTMSWALETTGDASPVAFEQELWWAGDRSARRRMTPVAPAAGKTVVTDFAPGEFALVVDSPSEVPPILAGQLNAHQPLVNGPQATIRAVADMSKQHPFSAGQCAAALRVLADTDELVDRGAVVDRAGRAGIAISADSDGGKIRDMAIFDPTSGVLLSYERVALVSPARINVPPPVVIAYVLFLEHERTDQIG